MKDQGIGSNMPPCHVSPIEKEQQVGTDVESSNLSDTGKEQQMSYTFTTYKGNCFTEQIWKVNFAINQNNVFIVNKLYISTNSIASLKI